MSIQSAASAQSAGRSGPSPTPMPVRIRLAALTLLAVYPFITALLYLVFPLTDGWPLYARTLVVAPLMVVAMMFVIMPLLQRRFGRFIASGKF